MPVGPIVDSHVHLWEPTRFRMPWLDNVEKLNRSITLADYDEHTAGLEIAAMVYLEVDVEPSYRLLEAQWAVERAREEPRLRGVVASAPLEDGEPVRSFLEALVAIGPEIKGVRRLAQGEPDRDFYARPGFIRGAELLGEHGLSCDLCIKWPQMPATIEVVRRCPETQFILDHLGKPDINGQVMDPWRDQISELASLPNVVCKVSGAATEADWDTWTVEDIRPYIEHVLHAFGEDRVLFGGDWPVVLNASSYRRWVDALDTITEGRSKTALRKLWRDNATRVYRLGG